MAENEMKAMCGLPVEVRSTAGLGGCKQGADVFCGKQVSLFAGVASKHSREPIERTFFRIFGRVVVCVLFPCGIQAAPAITAQDRSEFEVCRQMVAEVFLQESLGEVARDIKGSGVKFDKYIVERGEKLCLGLLDKQATRSIAGNFAANPGTTNAGNNSTSDAYPSCDDRISHVLWYQAGGSLAGLLILAAFGFVAMRRSAA